MSNFHDFQHDSKNIPSMRQNLDLEDFKNRTTTESHLQFRRL